MYRSLRTSAEFQHVFRHGTRRRSGGLLVIRCPGSSGPPRVGFVVGRKVGGAVERNRARRRLREAIREVPLEQGSDYVIVASAPVVDAPFASLIGWLKGGVAGEETKE